MTWLYSYFHCVYYDFSTTLFEGETLFSTLTPSCGCLADARSLAQGLPSISLFKRERRFHFFENAEIMKITE